MEPPHHQPPLTPSPPPPTPPPAPPKPNPPPLPAVCPFRCRLRQYGSRRQSRRLPRWPIFTSLGMRLGGPSPSTLPRLLFPFLPPPRPTRMLHHRLLMFVRTRRHRGSRPTRIRLRISGFTCVESEMAVTCHYVTLRGVMYARREACKKQQAAAAAGMMVISRRKPSFTSWSRQSFSQLVWGGGWRGEAQDRKG